MDFSIRGTGGAFARDRKPLPRRRGAAPQSDPPQGRSDLPPPSAVHQAWLPEQSRALIAAVNEAVQAAETAAGVVATARAALSKIGGWISVLENEAVEAARWAAGDEGSAGRLSAHQAGVENAREEIEALVAGAGFGKLRLLDGSLGSSGKAFGDGLEFVTASPRARASPPDGFPVWIWQEATRATSVLELPAPGQLVAQPLRLTIEADGRQAVYHPGSREGPAEVVEGLRRRVAEGGLEVSVLAARGGGLIIRHQRYGSGHGFTLKSSHPGVFSLEDGRPRLVNNGQDVAGSINGEPAFGEGEVLTGCAGNRTTDGLSVRFSGSLPEHSVAPPGEEKPSGWDIGLGPEPLADGDATGRVILAQHGLVFRMGPGRERTITIRLNSMRCRRLGLGVETPSGFQSLADIRMGSANEVCDALPVIRRAGEEVAVAGQRLAEVADTVLGAVLAGLRAQAGGGGAFDTNIADPGGALQVARTLREHIPAAAQLALSAQDGSLPGAILRLLSGEDSRV